jgi:ATPase subunit of ABC transporter with duplicated ATPase domains
MPTRKAPSRQNATKKAKRKHKHNHKHKHTAKKSKRVLEMESDPTTVWGKNKPLEEFWRSLASGKKVVLIDKNGKHKMVTMPTKVSKMYNAFDDDPSIVAVLSSNMSQDAYEVFLYPKAKDNTVEHVIKNYKKYFKPIGPMPSDLIEKGVPAQKKVFFPA